MFGFVKSVIPLFSYCAAPLLPVPRRPYHLPLDTCAAPAYVCTGTDYTRVDANDDTVCMNDCDDAQCCAAPAGEHRVANLRGHIGRLPFDPVLFSLPIPVSHGLGRFVENNLASPSR